LHGDIGGRNQECLSRRRARKREKGSNCTGLGGEKAVAEDRWSAYVWLQG